MMGSLTTFKKLSDTFDENGFVMPIMFVGHGSPMNGIEDNDFSRKWAEVAKGVPVPSAVLVISAHWLTHGSYVTAMNFPKTIHDFEGFPKALNDVQYPAPGSPAFAAEVSNLVKHADVIQTHEWGLDHGAWTVVRHMYPEANIPVVQLSIDFDKGALYHFKLAEELKTLRKKGVLIIGSGNMVHNLRMIAWDKLSDEVYGYDWALEMNENFKQLISSRDYKRLIDYKELGSAAKLAVPTPDHYYPLLYSLGLSDQNDKIDFFNDRPVGGSLTMTSVLFGSN